MIKFQNVDVSFKQNKKLVEAVKNVSFDIEKGSIYGIVGGSGAGKSTLLRTVNKLQETTSGEVFVNGKDITKIKGKELRNLRKNIGIVQQDVYLFAGTVYDNIAYGNPKATKEEIIEAAKLAGAHEFISEFKDGYDTYVGERGVKLSGGQKQRISIARVFLKNPKILILDEATSALDNESEYLVSKSLERLAKGRTTLTIAHRLTTIQNADRILVLNENGIVEQGSHKELLDKKGVYHQLYMMANEIA